MDKPDKKSPIKRYDEPFTLNSDFIVPNTFQILGTSARGYVHIILINKTTLDYKDLRLMHGHPIEHSPECYQYLITGIEGSVVGSLFSVNIKKTTFKPYVLGIDDSHSKSESLHTCSSDNGVGGTLVYDNDSGSIIVVPATLDPNKFVVQ